MRVWPNSTRCRTAARAPRYWSTETTDGLRRADAATATNGMPRSSSRTTSSSEMSSTMCTIASTFCRSSDSTIARTAGGSTSSRVTVSTLYRAARAATLKCIVIDAGP
jgi:hypothetical protein